MSGIPESRPLYQQVKLLIIQQIVEGRWQPGDALPSEFQLGDEFKVSQGTVRKALDALARDGMVVRRQGKGTFVAEHDQQETLFKFFHLVCDGHERELPESNIYKVEEDRASEAERALLFFESKPRVFRIHRVRMLNMTPIIAETIIVPAWLIRNRAEAQELPNTAYRYYQQIRGVTIVRAVEKLRAVPATKEDAKLLGLSPGSPILEIDRIAKDLMDRAVEMRISRCNTDDYYYLSELG